MNNQQVVAKTKDYRLDKLRAISCIMVVIIHVANYYGREFGDVSAMSFLGALIYSTISRVSVPVFFMISGMLLLNKPVDLRKNTKRIVEKFLYSAFTVLLITAWDVLYVGEKFKNYIGLLGEPERRLLWFLYAIIAIYIALPFIRRMVENMTAKEDLLFVALWVVFNGCLYIAKYKYKIPFSYPIPIINGTYYLGYFVMGHLIAKHLDTIKKWISNIWVKLIAVVLGLGAYAATIILSFVKSYQADKFYYYFFNYRSLFIIVSSVVFFVLFYIYSKNNENKIVSIISKYSFEIYLFHAIPLDFVMLNVNFKAVNSFIGIPLYTLIIFLMTLLIAVVVQWFVGLFKRNKHKTV